MRILISSPAGLGHINPMIPLAQAAQARGHEVRWLVAAEHCDYVERAGIHERPGWAPEVRTPRKVRFRELFAR